MSFEQEGQGQDSDRSPQERSEPKAMSPPGLSRVWIGLLLMGLCLHCGSAVIRLAGIGAYPLLRDFAGYHATVRVLMEGKSPFPWQPSLLAQLSPDARLPADLAAPASPPVWVPFVWLFGYVSFPVASLIWLLLSALLLVFISLELSLLAGATVPERTAAETGSGGSSLTGLLAGRFPARILKRAWVVRLLVFTLVVTFGPVTLTLMLGQNSLVLLAGALFVGAFLEGRASLLAATLGFVASVAGKLYPAFWLVPTMLMCRWKLFVACVLLLLLLVGLTYVLFPTACEQYVKHSVPEVWGRVGGPGKVELDDQSLLAVLRRLMMESDHDVPLATVTETRKVHWRPGVSTDPSHLLFWGLAFSLFLLAPACVAVVRTGRSAPVANFYMWVLVPLLFFPHLPRYNHVLLLPATAWLISRGATGFKVGISVYLLAGLSRFTHLWAITLPFPLGPMATGFGLYAVIVAILGMTWLLLREDVRITG